MNRYECLPHHSHVYLEEVECETCCLTLLNVYTKVLGLALLETYFIIKSKTYTLLFLAREELLCHSMHFILHVLDDQLESERMDPSSLYDLEILYMNFIFPYPL